MSRKGYIGRDPDAPKRTERALREIADKLNDLTRRGEIYYGNDGQWHLGASADASGGTPPFFLPQRSRQRPFFFPGIQGDTGATGAAGADGSGGDGGGVPPRSYLARRARDTWTPPGGIDSLDPTMDTDHFLRGDGVWATPGTGGGVGWDLSAVASGDEGVSNSTTLVSHSELQHSVTAGSVWYYELYLAYEGSQTDANSDIKWNWNVDAGTFNGQHQWLFMWNVTNNFDASQARTSTTANWTSAKISGCITALTGIGWFKMLNIYTSNATASLQFAQNSAVALDTATVKAGSVLLGRRII